ncbi:hypothetical protein NBE99_07760 [Thermosynechococcus sp. HN-54]|uniref:hypothetical protein n=1 Tax=Thermosynechococcus sp. HN-54 TaxID=2933959 RepID=UPI00202CF5BC|nr:hypothetical protein [Thermosynechococcus sp. HN-54]URR34542.1 hypothetical protein NBE99_07760 [Thermosynechococcus sp. HN-54]
MTPLLDGTIILPDTPLGAPLRRRLLHVNGVGSDRAKQLRDLNRLAALTAAHPLEIRGIHNQTHGFQADLLESFLGKAELYHFWPENPAPDPAKDRRYDYAKLLGQLVNKDLADDADILAIAQPSQLQQRPLSLNSAADLTKLLDLSFLQKLGWGDFVQYLYGVFPVGAPRPTLRLAYEIVKGLQTGAELYLVAHSQGLIITALACHIVRQLLLPQTKWMETVHLIGYGPAIFFADLPPELQPRTILIQHRQDVVAETLSNLRNVDLWSNLQTQMEKVMHYANDLLQVTGQDSHHSASFYLGLQDSPSSRRSVELIQILLTQSWSATPSLAVLKGTRVILEL